MNAKPATFFGFSGNLQVFVSFTGSTLLCRFQGYMFLHNSPNKSPSWGMAVTDDLSRARPTFWISTPSMVTEPSEGSTVRNKILQDLASECVPPIFFVRIFFQRRFFQWVFRPSWEGLICHFQCVQPHPHAALELIASRAFAKPMEGSLDSGRRHPAHHIPTNRSRPLCFKWEPFFLIYINP